MMHKTLIAFLAALALPAVAQWAYRVPCELQSRDLPAALKTLTWQQGTTPLIQLDLLNNGKPQAVDTNAQAVLIFGPSATSSYFVPTTNTVATGTYYQVQLPTIGTNTAGAAWWYTVYFEVNGLRYWTGNGEVYIEATTSTADGLEWQQLTTSGQVTAEAVLRVAGDLAGSNYADTVSTAAQSAAQAYAGTLLSTGTAARATSADYATVAGVATNATYVLGPEAWITMSGTTGMLYRVETNTNVIRVVSHSQDYNGPLGPFVLDPLYGNVWRGQVGEVIYEGTWRIPIPDYFEAAGSMPVDMTAVWDALGTVTIDWGLQTNAYAIATTADLDAALAAYSTNGHVHAIADVTGLQDALDSIPDEIISGAAAGATAVQPADLSTARVDYATSAGTAGTVTGAQSNLITSALQAEADTLATVTARGSTTTNSLTIGSRASGTVGIASFAQGSGAIASGSWSHAHGEHVQATGLGSHAQGSFTVASGEASHAEGEETVASGVASHASGNSASALHDYSYAWSGTGSDYASIGAGTYNINPVGGVTGFYIGGTSLGSLLDAKATPAQATNIAEAAASAALATIPSAGCTDLSTSTNVTVTGATVTYAAAPSGPYTIGIATNAPRYAYAIEIAGTNAASFATGITLRGDWTPSGTNLVVLYPGTGTLYRAAGRAY